MSNLTKVEVLTHKYIVVQVFIKDPYIKNGRKLLIFVILWIICNKTEKYRK